MKGYAIGPYGQLHYQAFGEGIPLILCHQAGTSSVQFAEAYPLLAKKGIKAIGIDLPGYGMSDGLDRPLTIAEYAQAIPALLDHLGISVASVGGHHAGAMIALHCAVSYPDRIDKVILNAPLPFTKEESEDLVKGPLEDEKKIVPEKSGSYLLEAWNYRCRFAPGWTNLAAMHNQIVQHLATGARSWYLHQAVFTYDHADKWKAIKKPVLVLTNTGEIAWEVAKRVRDLRPDFSFTEMEGGTIDIIAERPEEWSEIVASFLRERAK